MKICFINSSSALLPEIDAYISFFSNFDNIETQVIADSTEVCADVEWYFMGSQRKRSNAVTIHEYGSSSVPPFGALKNTIKKIINCKPDYRLFFSDYVAKRFGFNDNVPFGFRGHGISEAQIHTNENASKKIDFIYVGTIDHRRKLDSLFQCFSTGALKNRTLLVLTSNYKEIAQKLNTYKNIKFAGPVPYREVYNYIAQSRFAINFMPDIEPYNMQVSSKFIDYIACGIPVVSSEYFWIKSFERKYGGRYFYLEKDLKNFTWENINTFRYDIPVLNGFLWKDQILKSGVIGFLRQKFPNSFLGSG